MSKYIIELDADELELLRDCVRFADQLQGDGTADAPTYRLRGKLHSLQPMEENDE